MGLDRFHNELRGWGLSLPTDSETIFDSAFLRLETLKDWSSFLEMSALFCVFLALVCELRGALPWSRVCMVVVAVLATMSALAPLLPNYVRSLELEHYYDSCPAGFTAVVTLLSSISLGASFSVLLGMRVFALLLVLPMSLVRALWL